MSPQITKEHAERIRIKLQASVVTKRKAHDMAQVFYNGVLIVQFGIRRGSRKDLGHGHLPDTLHISPRQTLDLAICPLSRDGYFEILKDRGFMPKAEEG
jgi:hypothetical protein